MNQTLKTLFLLALIGFCMCIKPVPVKVPFKNYGWGNVYPIDNNFTRTIDNVWLPYSGIINGTGGGCIQYNQDLVAGSSGGTTIQNFQLELDLLPNSSPAPGPMQFTYILYRRPSGFPVGMIHSVNSCSSPATNGSPLFDLQYTVIAGGTCLTRSSYESCKFEYDSLTDPFWRPGMLASGDVISLDILGGVNYGSFYDYSIYGHFNYQLNFP